MIEATLLTVKLVFLVTLGATLVGASLAWALRGARGLLPVFVGLPLVFSTLIYSFIYLSLFDEFGFYEFRSLFGLAIILSLNLAPYMYFSIRLGLMSFPESLKESLALSKKKGFLNKAFVYTRFLFPFWGAGFGFLSLEVLSEFGASFLFGQETLSVYVYNLWLEQFNFSKAIYGFVTLFMLVMLFFGMSLYFQKSRDLSASRKEKKKESVCPGLPLLYVVLAVLLPISFLLKLSFGYWGSIDTSKALSSFVLSLVVAFASLLVFLIMNKGSLFPGKKYLKIPGLIYGVPGVLIGMSFYFLGFKISYFVLVLALVLKYFKFLIDYLFSSWNEVSLSSKNARILVPGYKERIKIDYKVSYNFLMVAFAMIFVEVLKELPITLMMKPIMFNTLSTEIFTLVSEGDWELAAPYGVIVFIFGFCALMLNQIYGEKSVYAKN